MRDSSITDEKACAKSDIVTENYNENSMNGTCELSGSLKWNDNDLVRIRYRLLILMRNVRRKGAENLTLIGLLETTGKEGNIE